MPCKRTFCLVTLLLILALAISGCLPAPGSKTRTSRTSSSDIGTADEKSRSYMNLAAALILEQEYTMALSELEKAKAINPRNTDLDNYFGMAYYGLQEFELSALSYQKALSLRPDRTDIRNNLGLAYLAQKQYDQALAEFETAGKDLTYEKKYLPMANIGLTYLEMGRYDDALTALNKVTRVAPTYGAAYQLIGRTYLAKGNPRDAADYLNNAAKLNPDDPATYMALGEALGSLGRTQEAAEAYGRVATLMPNTPIALEAQKKARRLMGFD